MYLSVNKIDTNTYLVHLHRYRHSVGHVLCIRENKANKMAEIGFVLVFFNNFMTLIFPQVWKDIR